MPLVSARGPEGEAGPILRGPGDPVIFTLDHSVRDPILDKLVREVAAGFRSEALRTQVVYWRRPR